MNNVTLTVDGVRHVVPEGTIVGVLLHDLNATLRWSPRAGAARGLYCGMGVCFECTVRIDGRSDVRACLTPAADGMIVETLS